MKYLVIGYLLWPILRVIRFARPCSVERILVIQTAKIGDWINSTPLVRLVAPVDVVCDPVNVPLVSRDECVRHYYVHPGKCSLRDRLKLAWEIFWAGYQRIFVLMPNMPNTFIARLACAAEVRMLDTYRSKTLLRLLASGFRRYRHGRDHLALDSYLRLAELPLDNARRHKHATLPLHIPAIQLIEPGPAFRVGVSLSAGNAMKTMPTVIWKRLLLLLHEFGGEVYVFGLATEKKYLDALRAELPPEKTPSIVDCLGKLPLEALPWHISKMHLYLSTDTGNSYVADSQDVPLIDFSGPCYTAEQRPIGARALIVKTEKLRPFSFVFEAPYASDLSPEMLYSYSETQWEQVREHVKECRRAVPELDWS